MAHYSEKAQEKVHQSLPEEKKGNLKTGSFIKVTPKAKSSPSDAPKRDMKGLRFPKRDLKNKQS